MPPKTESEQEDKSKKNIIITSELLAHGEDSSDEEDDYFDISGAEIDSNAKKFAQANPDLPEDIALAAYILEDGGRRVLYDNPTRTVYQEKKKQFLSYKEADFDGIDVDFLYLARRAIDSVSIKLASAVDVVLKSKIDAAFSVIEDLQNLPRLILKQSNREFILSEFSDIFNPIIEHIVAENIKKIQDVPALQHQDEYKITSGKITHNEAIRKQLINKVKADLLAIKQGQGSYGQKVQLANDRFGVSITESVRKYFDLDATKEPHGKSINTLIESILTAEISKYLDGSFIDRARNGESLEGSYLLKMALDSASAKQIKTITDCRKSLAESAGIKEGLIEKKSADIREEFGRFFAENLNRFLAEKISLPKVVLKKTYNDSSKIKSPSDLYSKEHLLYRSATRQARSGEQEFARSVVFDDDSDLTAQKWQAIRSEAKSSANHVSYRGTIQEEVYNLGNYESVLDKIRSLKFADKSSAQVIRNVYKMGINQGLTSLKIGDKTLAEFFSHQQKQTIVELVELFFGTEAFRSPSTIVETNMALDLIIAEKLSWEAALTGKKTVGRGGDLSFTMKSSEQKAGKDKEKIEGAGGIECGRRLSEDVNRHHCRMHKYGGEPIEREKEGYKEYLSRKKEIADKWLEFQEEGGKPKTSIANPSAVKQLINEQEKAWYNR